MMQATLVYILKDSRVLLGMKKRGLGAGKWNGFGGRVKYGEDIHEAAEREVWEECCVKVRSMVRMAELTFIFPVKPGMNQIVHVFLSRDFRGEPAETDEMRPSWFERNELPFREMWSDDVHWLPRVLAGERVKGRFVFGADNERIESMKLDRF